ncbi:hypothetical protein AAG906_015056 [Vitis piasezkii]
MGAIQSKIPFSHSFSYRRLPQSPDSQSQPLLLQDHEITKEERFQTDNNEAKNKAMLKEIRETNSNFSRLETRISKEMDKREGALTALRKDVSELKIRVGKIENTPGLDAKVKEQEDKIEKLRQRNADLERETKELRTAVDDLKYIVFNSLQAPSPTAAVAPQVTGSEMNDLVGCLVVLIFLISILIGNNL